MDVSTIRRPAASRSVDRALDPSHYRRAPPGDGGSGSRGHAASWEPGAESRALMSTEPSSISAMRRCPSRQSRALGDPLPCNYTLRVLECTHRGQSGRRGLRSPVREVSGQRHHSRGNGIALGPATCRVSGDHPLRRRTTLHRHTGGKPDNVEPCRSDTGMGQSTNQVRSVERRILSARMSLFSSVSPSTARPTVSSIATNASM